MSCHVVYSLMFKFTNLSWEFCRRFWKSKCSGRKYWKNIELETSEWFTNFIDNIFSAPNGLKVLDKNEQDITEEFMEDASKYYDIGDYSSIQKMIINQNLDVSYSITEDVTPENELMNDIGTRNVSRMFYNLETDTSGRFTKEWLVTISGSYNFNRYTYQIISISPATLNLTTANFGAAFSPYLQNVSTNSTYSGTRATFGASYNMRATLGISIGDFPIGFDFNFESHSHSFTASSLQPDF